MARSSVLYRAGRITTSRHATRFGRPGRRARKVAVGRVLAEAGFWERLWR